MAVTRRAPFPSKGYVGRKGTLSFTHRINVGAAGAISSQDTDSGVTAAKQGTAGQYLLTFPTGYKRICELDCIMIGANSAIANGAFVDYETNNLDAGTKAGNILMQWRRGDTLAAADVPNPCTLLLTVTVEEGV
jgi:hypothetical protein